MHCKFYIVHFTFYIFWKMHRTHTCGELTLENNEQEITLSGWVSNRRDHGWIIFIDLRDRYGLTQIVFDPEHNEEAHGIADKVRWEFVIKVTGNVRSRPEGQANPKLVTGEIEVIIDNIEILSEAKTTPFEITDRINVNEEMRYKYRYLDIRRKKVQDNIIFRSKFLQYTRNWFANRDFLEVQTPIFTVSSPEWARDYLIPARLHPGKFYALPQAPQQYKQLLMVGGIDKYFQIAPCFRDEDTRADRHACEFYQIDCEMSFVEQEDIFTVAESYILDAIENLSDKKVIDNKVHRMGYREAMDSYGSDKPDLRFGLKFQDITDIFSSSDFAVFRWVCDSGGTIKAMKTEWISMSRKDIDGLTKVAQDAGARGLAYIIYDENGARSPILKFFSEDEIAKIEKIMQPKAGDIIFFSAADYKMAVNVLNVVRLAIRDKYELANKDEISLCWITDFPIYEQDKDTGKIDFEHNPFSRPKWGLEALETMDPLDITGEQFDLSMNGYEVLSGAIRNQDIKALLKAFDIVGRWEDEIKEKFGAMYEAFQYGAPPHGGFAFGMDRLMMILNDEDNIREIYAFPKSGKAQDMMMWAPDAVEEKVLDDLNIKLDIS